MSLCNPVSVTYCFQYCVISQLCVATVENIALSEINFTLLGINCLLKSALLLNA